eukprot:m.97126 g.97126  ORF g.97126 m.97126 type:complete len:147 (-) comp26949_c0_seq1:285-725(-)
MSGYPYFCLVGRDGVPIFEDWFDSKYSLELMDDQLPKDDLRYLHQFITNKALDSVPDLIWTTQSMYLKVIDDFNDFYVSAFLTAGGVKMLLLHDRAISNTDGIKNFFSEVHEVYVKALLNPLYDPGLKLEAKDLRTKVRVYAKRYL